MFCSIPWFALDQERCHPPLDYRAYGVHLEYNQLLPRNYKDSTSGRQQILPHKLN